MSSRTQDEQDEQLDKDAMPEDEDMLPDGDIDTIDEADDSNNDDGETIDALSKRWSRNRHGMQ